MAMMKALSFLIVYLIANGFALPVTKNDKQLISLEEIITQPSKFAQRSFNGTWISDTEFIYTIRNEVGLWLYNAETQKGSEFVNKEILAYLNTTDVRLSPDKKYLLARSDPQTGFRYSSSARFALFNLETNETYKIADHKRLEYCAFGGLKHSLGFVLQNDVYYLKDAVVSNDAVRLTNDGKIGVIYNGVPDWVYEEEVFASGSTMWFSNDGARMAIASFVDTNVDVALYFTYGEPGSVDDQYPLLNELRYPKVGRNNPDVSLRVINLNNSELAWKTLTPPAVGNADNDHILGSVTWASETEVAALWLNRRQNRSILVICNADTGVCKDERTREEPNGWIEITTPRFNGDQYLDIEFVEQGTGDSEEWLHLVKYKRGSKVREAITSGKRTVISIAGWNVKDNEIYYLSTLEDEPWQRHLWVAGAKSSCLSCNVELPEGLPCRYVAASFSRDAKYYGFNCQGLVPSVVSIHSTANKSYVVDWEGNEELRSTLSGYWLPQQMNLRVPVEGGFEAAVKFYLPPELDLDNPTGSYPMIVYVYAGPNSVRVTDTFSIGLQTYMPTNRSIIYCNIDGRGSGVKGKDMLFAVNNRLGTYEIEDIIDVTVKLTNMFSWIDKTKIGLWGWSYGGYATAMAVTRDSEEVFKCAISVAPVTSWLYYDTIYTERFMSTPQDNPKGYEEGDVTKRAEFFRNRNFLMLHGNADDNVHYQNAMALARSLQEKDIAFEIMSYPDEAHGLSGVSIHVYHTIDDFWTRCL